MELSTARPEAALALMGDALTACEEVDGEFSIRIRPGAVERHGRFGVWVDHGSDQDGATGAGMARLLAALDAPAEPMAACLGGDDGIDPIRLGIAAAPGPNGPVWKFYHHGRRTDSRADDYRAWRWRPGQPAVRADYRFHHMPETPDGLRPLDLAPDALRPAFAALLDEPRFARLSGFWLRRTAGRIDQLDLAFPWLPAAGTLPGWAALADALAVPEADRRFLADLPVRHVALSLSNNDPSVTLYCSATLEGKWPDTEAALQVQVVDRARHCHQEMERQVWSVLPALPTPVAPLKRSGLDRFYDGAAALWRPILGEGLHYHAGLFEDGTPEPDDAAMDRALRRAVTELYPFLPTEGRIYDIGCGWGGPMAMWIRDLGVPTLGVTVSRAQFRHVAALGLPVRWADVERTVPSGWFDGAVMLESLCHVADKARLLALLRPFCGRLVARVNCQDLAPPGRRFGGTMHMVTSQILRETVEAAGWRIRHWRDRRAEALPSVAGWSRRLKAIPPGDHRHVEVLRAWCAHVSAAPEAWADANPLIEFVAE